MKFRGLDDEDLERLSNREERGGKELGGEISQVLAELRAASARLPEAQVEAAHLAAMAEEARGIPNPPSARGDVNSGAGRVLADVRALSAKPPDAHVEAGHLRAMAELAQGVGSRQEPARSPVIMATRRPLTHKRLALGVVAPALALPLCVATLAAAGVGLPDAVRAPFDSIGITLSGRAQPGELRAAIQTDSIRDRGCIFDQDLGTGLGFGRAPLPGHLCERAASRAGESDRADAAGGKGGRDRQSRGPIVLAGLAEPPAAAAGAHNLLADSTAVQAAQVLGPRRLAPPSGGGHPGPTSAVGHPAPRPGGGHPAPRPGGGHPGPGPGGGHPGPPPVGPLPSPPPVKVATRPGKGCGDKNHVHERVDECK